MGFPQLRWNWTFLYLLDLDKLEFIYDVASVESIKEVERKLWLTHYYMLRETLMEVLRERCTRCQAYETNHIRHELCSLLSAEEQVNQCFEEVYARVSWEDVMDCWYKKVLEMPIVLNPETLAVFRETLNSKDVTDKNRLLKWISEVMVFEAMIVTLWCYYINTILNN